MCFPYVRKVTVVGFSPLFHNGIFQMLEVIIHWLTYMIFFLVFLVFYF